MTTQWKFPEVGDTTPWKTKFAWLPKRIHGKIVWLEKYQTREHYRVVSGPTRRSGIDWHENRWKREYMLLLEKKIPESM
jgi:hypothetical protein